VVIAAVVVMVIAVIVAAIRPVVSDIDGGAAVIISIVEVTRRSVVTRISRAGVTDVGRATGK
jgi:hypothetical protein